MLKTTKCNKFIQFQIQFPPSYLPVPDCKTVCYCHILSTTLNKMIIGRHAERMEKRISVSFAKLPVSTESQQISRHSGLKAACFVDLR